MAPAPNQAEVTELVHPLERNKNLRNKKKQNGSKINDDIDIFNDSYPPIEIVWINVILLLMVHAGALAGLYAMVSGKVMWQTCIFDTVYMVISAIGITAGAHRLWCHKSYKAKFPLRVFLAFGYTIAFQMSIYQWTRDHRVHHKYAETLADPHNVKRGFFFAHMGWLLVKKHPAVTLKGNQIDYSDLEADPIVMFQHKYYVPLAVFAAFLLPSFVPWYLWGETAYNALMVSMLKYAISLHVTWLVNSAAHYWGEKPYDRSINARENPFVTFFALGEGWHNYHHTFPWDYKTSELGSRYNSARYFIDAMAFIGQAYDLKTVPDHIVNQRIARTGDGTHEIQDINNFKPSPYAWGDEDIPESDVAILETLYPKKDI